MESSACTGHHGSTLRKRHPRCTCRHALIDAFGRQGPMHSMGRTDHHHHKRRQAPTDHIAPTQCTGRTGLFAVKRCQRRQCSTHPPARTETFPCSGRTGSFETMVRTRRQRRKYSTEGTLNQFFTLCTATCATHVSFGGRGDDPWGAQPERWRW